MTESLYQTSRVCRMYICLLGSYLLLCLSSFYAIVYFSTFPIRRRITRGSEGIFSSSIFTCIWVVFLAWAWPCQLSWGLASYLPVSCFGSVVFPLLHCDTFQQDMHDVWFLNWICALHVNNCFFSPFCVSITVNWRTCIFIV